MKISKYLTIMTALSLLYFGLPLIAQAACTKYCYVHSEAHLTFMMKPKPGGHESDQRRAVCSLASFKAEGYYGGGCRTAVGRQKARKRACKAAKKVAQNAYKGKPLEWRKDLCRKKAGSTGKYSLIFVRGSGGKVEMIPHDEVKWIKFSRIKFRARAEDGGTTKSVKKRGEFTIKGDGNKFACKDGKPVPAGN